VDNHTAPDNNNTVWVRLKLSINRLTLHLEWNGRKYFSYKNKSFFIFLSLLHSRSLSFLSFLQEIEEDLDEAFSR
jgi:hypothetical protein